MRKSADIKINDKLKDIKIGLTLTSKRPFANIIKEKNTSKIFNNRNANCHSYPKIKITVVYDHLFLLKKIQKN